MTQQTCTGGKCVYPIMEDGRCYFHAAVAAGRITDAYENRLLGFRKIQLPEFPRELPVHRIEEQHVRRTGANEPVTAGTGGTR